MRMKFTCPFCTSELSHVVATPSSVVTSRHVEYRQCTICYSIIQFPYPSCEVLETYYESYREIKSVMNPGYLEEAAYDRLKTEREKTLFELGFDLQSIKKGVHAELGCANGLFLRFLSDHGAKNIIGMDVSSNMLSSISFKTKATRTLYQGGLEKLDDSSVDFLYLFNVIEHICDINLLFKNINRVTTDTAIVFIEIPVVGFLSSLHGKRWRFLMPDEHVNIPSMKGLQTICEMYDLEVVSQTRFGSGWTSGSIYEPLKRLFDYLAKKTNRGDRGCFRIQKRKSKGQSNI